MEPSTSTQQPPVIEIDNTGEDDLFDLPKASQSNTPTKLFTFRPKPRPDYDPPIAIESEEDAMATRMTTIFLTVFLR